MKWLKNFKNLFSPVVTTIIVIAIIIYTLTQNVGGSHIFERLETLVPIILVSIAVIGMQLAKQSLASHLILLLAIYLQAGTALVSAVTSFDFESMSFAATWTVQLIVNAVIFVYLLFYVLSFVLDGKAKYRLQNGPVVTSAIIAFIFFFLRDGFSSAVLKIIPALVALMFGSDLFAIVLLLAGVIDVPFDIIGKIVDGVILDQTIGYFLFSAFALHLTYGAIKGIIKNLK